MFIVWSAFDDPGFVHAIITILDLAEEMNESLKTIVSFEVLKGTWLDLASRALMHSFKAKRLLLISAPSSLLYLLLL